MDSGKFLNGEFLVSCKGGEAIFVVKFITPKSQKHVGWFQARLGQSLVTHNKKIKKKLDISKFSHSKWSFFNLRSIKKSC